MFPSQLSKPSLAEIPPGGICLLVPAAIHSLGSQPTAEDATSYFLNLKRVTKIWLLLPNSF